MALVAYSDSEGSDSEGPAPSPKQAPKPATTSKSGFTKLVDRSNPTKIKVNLPGAAPSTKDSADESTTSARPAKRARTEGGGFNSMLPAPKRTGAIKGNAAGSASSKRGLGKGLGAGVSLRTGAEPSFSRERVDPDPDLFNDLGPKDEAPATALKHYEKPSPGPTIPDAEPPQNAEKEAQEPKNIRRKMLFRPLSVMNNQKKKKATSAASASPAATTASAATPSTQPASNIAPPKPKVSLFSMSASAQPTHTTSNAPYEPLLHRPPTPPPADLYETPQATSYQEVPLHDSDPPNPLAALASDLSLPPSARRQLFGRHAMSDGLPANVNITTFNMDAQYAENEAARASGEQIGKAPVRAVAGGKHSLKQLISNASGQAEALEEQFAEGRRNRKEAGSKYGW